MTMTIRTAATTDAEAIAALGREFVEYLRSLGAQSPRCLSAEEYVRDGFGERPEFRGLLTGCEQELFLDLPEAVREVWLDLVEATAALPEAIGCCEYFVYVGRCPGEGRT
jgi:hypothetical protein